MRTTIRRPTATAFAAAALIASVLPAAAIGTPTGAVKTLNHPQSTTAKTFVTPIAATKSPSSFGQPWAVFERQNRVGDTADPSGDLLAVTASGAARSFGTATPDMGAFSLSGYTLTAPSRSDRNRVYWWQPPQPGAQGGDNVATVAAGRRYLASAPDGWVEIDAAGMLYDVSATEGEGSARAIGDPFDSAQDVNAVSGPAGVVVWNDSQIAFVSFADSAVTPLDVSRLTDLPGGTNTPVCWSVSARGAACGSYYFTGEDNSGIRNIFLDPLDGGPAYAVTADQPQPATMLGARAGWLTESGKLRVLTKSGVVRSAAKVGASPVAGLGGFLTTDPKRHVGLELSSDARHTTTVLRATSARTEATEFALAAGSVVWLESASHGATVRQRTLATTAVPARVTAGPNRRVATSKARRGQLAAAGDTVAYPTELNNSAVGQNGGETLRVITASRRATIRGVDRYLPVTVGAHRVAYFTDDRHARLYNLHTHRSTAYTVSGFALSGHWLAYADLSGVIRLKDLANGSVRTVATGARIVSDQLFVHGQLVAWNSYPPGAGGDVAFYRDMSGTAAAAQLPDTVNVWQLSDAGLVLEQTTSAPGAAAPLFPSARTVRFHSAMTFLLQPYGATAAAALLTADYPMAGPQVAGGVLAWIDRNGDLKAQPLS
ncbi:MAG TPA: hypothetical protein VG650_13625 [Mycobacteriales bacterium]|nr:hypothetical protein [Mycobacteriales bacterium]